MQSLTDKGKQDFFSILNIIFIALSVGQLVFFGIAFILASQDGIKTNAELESILIYISPVYSIAMIFFSRFMYNRISQSVDRSLDIKLKLLKYRTASIVSWASLESATLFSLVSYLLTGNYIHLLIFAGVFAGFIINHPSKDKFMVDYNVTPEDIKEL